MKLDDAGGSPTEHIRWHTVLQSFWPAKPPDHELAEQVELVRRNFGFALLCACGGAWVLTFALAAGGSATASVWCWVGVNTAYSVLAVWRVRRVPETWPPERKARCLLLWMVGLSLSWSSIMSLAMFAGKDDVLLGTTLVLTSVLAGSLAFTAPHLPVYFAFNGPVMVLAWFLAIGLKVTQDRPGATLTGIAAGVPLYLLANWYFAANASRMTLASIRLRFERQALIHDLEEQRGMAESARRDAEDANRAKSVFLAAASHDLRQPIHALGLFLGALDRRSMDPRQTDTLAGADRSLKASREMLDALLDFSRIEAGVVHAKAEPFLLQPRLFRLVSEFGHQADEQGLVLRLRDTTLAVHADPMLVERILRNLLTNALRYTGRGGVLIGVRRRRNPVAQCPDTIVIEVWDTGDGIDVADQAHVFREFYQLSSKSARDHRKGLGLGLAIVQGLCEAMGAQVTLSSRPGRGSVFRLKLSAAPSGSERRLQARERYEARLQSLPGSLVARMSHTWRDKPLHVLLVEDHDDVRKGLALAVAGAGWEVRAVASIEAALDLLRDWRPDILVTDYRLAEERHGGDAVRLVREWMGAPQLPAIIITGDTAPDRLREARSVQAHLLHKPLAAESLIAAIDQLSAGWIGT